MMPETIQKTFLTLFYLSSGEEKSLNCRQAHRRNLS